MMLTREEYEWATDIKEMIEGMPDLDNLSDYWYAQLALICKGRTDEAVDRAYGLQAFVQEYGIVNSYPEGCRLLEFLISNFPRQFLHWGFAETEGAYIFSFDMSQFHTDLVKSLELFNNWMRSVYYLHLACVSDLQSLRTGCIVLIECANVNWTNKQDYKTMKRMMSEFLCFYPIKMSLRHYHTGMVVNILTTLFKQVLPKEMKDSIQMGYQLQSDQYQTLSDLYLVPDVPTANQRVLMRLQDSLKTRYHNEKEFSWMIDGYLDYWLIFLRMQKHLASFVPNTKKCAHEYDALVFYRQSSPTEAEATSATKTPLTEKLYPKDLRRSSEKPKRKKKVAAWRY